MVAPPEGSTAGDSAARARGWSGFDLLSAAVGLSVVAYGALRAIKVPITFDEAYTYLVYVRAAFAKILPLDPAQAIPPLTANNHVLNSLLAKAAAALFGPSPFALRLPNVAAHALFLACIYSILRRHSTGLLRAMGFIVVAANPYLIEFFSVCRGYGLSLALLAAALDCLDRALSNERRPIAHFALCALFAGLAVMANYTLLDVYVPLTAIAALSPFLDRRSREPFRASLRAGALQALPFVAVFLSMAIPFSKSFELLRSTAFWFGGSRGFVRDTILSLASGTLYEPNAGSAPAILAGVVALLLAGLSAGALAGSGKPRDSRLLKAVLFLLAGSAALSVIQHAAFGAAYLEGRTALFLLPLTALALVLGAAALPAARRRFGQATIAALALASWWNTSRTANLRYSYTWRQDADTPRMLRDLDALTQARRGERQVRLGVDWLFVPGVEYYRIVEKIAWLLPVDRDSLWRQGNDYVYLLGTTAAEAKRRGVRLLRGYPTSGNLLGAPAGADVTRTGETPRSEGATPARPGAATPARSP